MRQTIAYLVTVVILLLSQSAASQQEKTADYRAALSLMWGSLYEGGGRTLYCNEEFGRNKGRGINVEHVMPMSWAAYTLKCGPRDECRRTSRRFNYIEADLHNMWPSRVDVNKARRSYPFAIVKGEARPFPGCDIEIDERNRKVEPRAPVRGEIARSMFYMHDAYGISIRPSLGRTLKRWNQQDPVSDEERRRNDVIESLQGVRNPFIDDPQRASRLRF